MDKVANPIIINESSNENKNGITILVIVIIIVVLLIVGVSVYLYYKNKSGVSSSSTSSTSTITSVVAPPSTLPNITAINMTNAQYLPVQSSYNVSNRNLNNYSYNTTTSNTSAPTSTPSTSTSPTPPASTSTLTAVFNVTFPSITLSNLDPTFITNYNNIIAKITNVPVSQVVTTAPIANTGTNSGIILTTTVTDSNVLQVSDFTNLYNALQNPANTFIQLIGGNGSTPVVTYTSGIGPQSSTNVNFVATFASGNFANINQANFSNQYNSIISGVAGVNVATGVNTTLSSGSIIATTTVYLCTNTLTGNNPSILNSYNTLIAALQDPNTTFAPLYATLATSAGSTGGGVTAPVITNVAVSVSAIPPSILMASRRAVLASVDPAEIAPTTASVQDESSSLTAITANPVATPATSTAPTASKSKKGFVAGTGDPTAGVKISALNAIWYYTWGATPPALIGQPPGIKFTPMIWNITKISSAGTATGAAQVVADLTKLTQSTTDNIILTYNEPDGINQSAQGNMLVGDAVSFWPNIINATVSTYTTPPRIGSPVMYGDTVTATTAQPGTKGSANQNNMPQPIAAQLQNFPAGPTPGTYTVNISNDPTTPNYVDLNPLIWLDNFLIQVASDYKSTPSKYTNRGPFPDFICIHSYGKPNVTAFTNYLTAVNEKYNLPIWVTEYSCADWGATCTGPAPCTTIHTATTAPIDWSYPTDATAGTSTTPYTTPTNQTALFMQQTAQWMNNQPSTVIERFTWKERFLLVPSSYIMPLPTSIPNTVNQYCPVPAGCPTDSSSSIISATNPDYMGQSALFNSYEHFPTSLPPLTPLGKLYSSL